MFKDLNEFGQDIIIEIEKISFVQKTTRVERMPSGLCDEIYLLNLVCDGAFLTIDFRGNGMIEWNKCYEYLKSHIGVSD